MELYASHQPGSPTDSFIVHVQNELEQELDEPDESAQQAHVDEQEAGRDEEGNQVNPINIYSCQQLTISNELCRLQQTLNDIHTLKQLE
jgi:hypothetical protein